MRPRLFFIDSGAPATVTYPDADAPPVLVGALTAVTVGAAAAPVPAAAAGVGATVTVTPFPATTTLVASALGQVMVWVLWAQTSQTTVVTSNSGGTAGAVHCDLSPVHVVVIVYVAIHSLVGQAAGRVTQYSVTKTVLVGTEV